MVSLIGEVHRIKEYREETFYLAVSLADRYLVYLLVSQSPIPCLVKLSLTCILMAAKLEQPISPSFNRMVKLALKEWNAEVEI
jgi:hypothetical protein